MENRADKRVVLNIERKVEIPARIQRLLAGFVSDYEFVIADTGHISEGGIIDIVFNFVSEILLLLPQHSVKSFTCEFPPARGTAYHFKITFKWGSLSINITPSAFENNLIPHGDSLQELMAIRP